MNNPQKRKWNGNPMDITIESKKQAIANYKAIDEKKKHGNSIDPRGSCIEKSLFSKI